MTAEAQRQRAVEAVEALDRGDLDGFLGLWADDAVWWLGGDNPYAGVYRGRQQISDLARRQMSSRTFRFDVADVLADDKHVVLMLHTTGEHDGTSLDVTTATFVTADDRGEWISCWWLPNDQAAYDRFWS